MKRWLILFTVGCLVLAGVANAAVQQGDTELDLAAGWTKTNSNALGSDTEEWFIDAGIGYFMTDNIQVGGIVSASWMEEDGADMDVYGIGAGIKYHFMPTNQWVPYIGLDALWVYLDEDGASSEDGLAWGPVAGLRYELNAYNDFFVEYGYTTYDGDVSDYLDDTHSIIVGLIHQFK